MFPIEGAAHTCGHLQRKKGQTIAPLFFSVPCRRERRVAAKDWAYQIMSDLRDQVKGNPRVPAAHEMSVRNDVNLVAWGRTSFFSLSPLDLCQLSAADLVHTRHGLSVCI